MHSHCYLEKIKVIPFRVSQNNAFTFSDDGAIFKIVQNSIYGLSKERVIQVCQEMPFTGQNLEHNPPTNAVINILVCTKPAT